MTDPDLVAGTRDYSVPGVTLPGERPTDRLDPAAEFVNDAALAPLLAELKAELVAATEKNEQLQERVDVLEEALEAEESRGCDCDPIGPGYDVMVNTVRQVHDLTHPDGWAVCTDPVCRIVSRFA